MCVIWQEMYFFKNWKQLENWKDRCHCNKGWNYVKKLDRLYFASLYLVPVLLHIQTHVKEFEVFATKSQCFHGTLWKKSSESLRLCVRVSWKSHCFHFNTCRSARSPSRGWVFGATWLPSCQPQPSIFAPLSALKLPLLELAVADRSGMTECDPQLFECGAAPPERGMVGFPTAGHNSLSLQMIGPEPVTVLWYCLKINHLSEYGPQPFFCLKISNIHIFFTQLWPHGLQLSLIVLVFTFFWGYCQRKWNVCGSKISK